jgi:hypothetical protein
MRKFADVIGNLIGLAIMASVGLIVWCVIASFF